MHKAADRSIRKSVSLNVLLMYGFWRIPTKKEMNRNERAIKLPKPIHRKKMRSLSSTIEKYGLFANLGTDHNTIS